jgi:DNA-binding transcriptional MerR regulator
MAEQLTIGEMAKRCGLTAHTLRYYERIGLIQAVARGSDGRRRYVAQDADWIAFINRMRATGMPIARMLEFAAYRREGDSSVPQRRALLEGHTEGVRVHIAQLQECLAVLEDKVRFYRDLESSMTPKIVTDKGNDHGNKHECTHKRTPKHSLQPRPRKTR